MFKKRNETISLRLEFILVVVMEFLGDKEVFGPEDKILDRRKYMFRHKKREYIAFKRRNIWSTNSKYNLWV